MESIKLEPGWLARQMQEVRAEVQNWPPALMPLRSLNASLVHRSEVPEVSTIQVDKATGNSEAG